MEIEAYFEAIENGDVDRLRDLVTDDPALMDALTRPAYAPDQEATCTGLHAAVYARQLETVTFMGTTLSTPAMRSMRDW